MRGAEREFEVELGDYKPVNGWYLPFSFTIGGKGSSAANKAQYAWERIEANVALDDRLFARPAAGAPPRPDGAANGYVLPPAVPKPVTLPAPVPPHAATGPPPCGSTRKPPRASARAISAPPP